MARQERGEGGNIVDESAAAVPLTGELTLLREADRPEDEASAPPAVLAEWALWGKDAHESAYHVLRCSEGTFDPDDFREIITRYSAGVKDDLPQYTVCWIPGEGGVPAYVAVGIHELADVDPQRSGGRSRHDANGREIEFVRLFCVRYADLAEHAVSYRELVRAVHDQLLRSGLSGPIKVELPAQTAPNAATGPPRALAENVATLLLATRQVCVLGAEDAAADDRLAFIDTVMALLPYGLRCTMSASTWASSTAQDLKLRLFFSNAERSNGGQTSYVTWGQPSEICLTGPAAEAADLYLSWLRNAGPRAAGSLLFETDPVRFSEAEIRQMIGNLPKDKSVTATLEQLASSLRENNVSAIRAAVQRLKRHLAGRPDPSDRIEYRRLIAWHGLLNDRDRLHRSTLASVYRVVLRLAFDVPLSYASYCEIEDCLGSPPRGLLRGVMIELRFADYLSWVLAHLAVDRPDAGMLMESLHRQGMWSAAPLSLVERHVGGLLRPAHAKIALDFAVSYLRRYADDPRAELAGRGYLARALEIVYADDRGAQVTRLLDYLRFVFGGPLSRGQISGIFQQPGLYPSIALEAAIVRMTRRRRVRRYISEQAMIARFRDAGLPYEPAMVRRTRRPRSLSADAWSAMPRPVRLVAGFLLLGFLGGLAFAVFYLLARP